MNAFVAKKIPGTADYAILQNDWRIGHITFSHRVAKWMFVSNDTDLAEHVNYAYTQLLEQDLDAGFKGILQVIRKEKESLDADEAAIYESEMRAENAWLRAAEYDPEAVAQMEWEDANGFT